MLTKKQEEALVRAIYSNEELKGCIVGYHGGGQSRLLSEGETPSINFGRVIVIVEEVQGTPAEAEIPQASGSIPLEEPPGIVTNKSRIGREALGTGLSCGVAVATGLGAVGGVLGSPVTGGTSLGLTVLAWTGFLTSAAQCAYGIARMVEIHDNPNDDSIERMDNDPNVKRAVWIVDFVGLSSGALTIGVRGLRFLSVLSKNSSRLSEQAVRGMSRAQRTAVITEEIAELQKTDAGKKILSEALKEAGATARDLERILPRGLNHGGTYRVASAVSSALSKPHAKALTDAIREALIGAGISATPASVTGSASGVVNDFIVNVINK